MKKLAVALRNVAKAPKNRINYKGTTRKTTPKKTLGELPNHIFKFILRFSFVSLFSKLKLAGLFV